MFIKFNFKRYNWRFFIALLLIISVFSTSIPPILVFAQPLSYDPDAEQNLRTDILAIADAYANFHWTATEKNIWHGPYNYLPDPEHPWLLEPNSTDVARLINKGGTLPGLAQGAPVFEEDMNAYLIDTPTWWVADNVTENVGIPYAWGGTTPIESNLNLGTMSLIGGYFRQRLVEELPAGNIDTSSNTGGYLANGVDCEGLVEVAWRMGGRYGMAEVQPATRPIRFENLRPGDILMSYGGTATYPYPPPDEDVDVESEKNGHVMLFKEFVNYAGGNPVLWAGNNQDSATTFKVYEASYSAGKVKETTYALLTFTPRPTSDDSNDPVLFYKGHRISTDQMTLIDVDTQDPSGPDDDKPLVYTPRTYINPIKVIFVFDIDGPWLEKPVIVPKSYSYDAELIRGQYAALAFVNSMRVGDKIGVLPLYSTPQNTLPLTEIQSATQKLDAFSKITQIFRNQSSPVSGGLTNAYNQLLQDLEGGQNYDPNKDYNDISGLQAYTSGQAMVIFVSNGNNTENIDHLLSAYKAVNIPIYTLDTGSQTKRRAWLQDLSTKTLGKSYYDWSGADTFSAFFLLQDLIQDNYSEDPLLVDPNSPGSLPSVAGNSSSQTAASTVTVDVDASMGTMTFSLQRSGSAVGLTLTPPGAASVIGPDVLAPNISYYAIDTLAVYKVHAPQTGQWTMNISGPAGSQYLASASTWAAMDQVVETDKQEYAPGETMKLTASIKDTALLNGPEYLTGLNVEAYVSYEGVQISQSPLVLMDDGLSGDEVAGDGIYTATFDDTTSEGLYTFDVKILGSIKDQPFARERFVSVVVNTPPMVESVQRVSVTPTGYYDIDYTVTFSEPVAGVDVGDFVVTSTDEISDARVTSVVAKPGDTSGKIYVATVNAGNGNGTLRLDVIDDDTILDEFGGHLGGTGFGNGNFITGDVYTIDKTGNSSVVTKLDDTDDGFCNVDCSLREAVESVIPGDTITFDAGLSGADETIHLASVLTLTREVSIDGSALAELVISGDSDDDGTPDTLVLKVTSDAVVTLEGLAIKNGKRGILSDGELTIINSIISDNESDSSGGGISNRGILTILDSIFDSNGIIGQGYLGGGIYNSGALVISDTIFSNNFAIRGGGAIYNAGSLVVTNSTFSGNTAPSAHSGLGNGGAIYAYKEPIVISNSTFFGNSAQYGGGIYLNRVTLALTNSTFSDNTATKNGGGLLLVGSGILDYSNNIITNSSGGDCYLGDGTIGTNSRNFVGDGTCNPDPTLIGDLLLGPLADNGGPTQTMALGLGSLAIDKGDSAACPATDQRGVARPQGDGCDIGAYEVVSLFPGAFGKVSPSDGATGQSSSLTLSWASSSGADTYEYCLDTRDNGACDTTWVSTGDQTSATPTGLTAATTYHWQVRAVNADGTTEADGETWWSFTTSLSCPAGGVIYVNQGASGNNDGSSWDNAFVDLQTPLASLNEPCEIWVAAGTYIPHVSDRAVSFQLKNEVEIYGGFVGTETIRSQRDFETNLTILSGDLLGNDNENITRDEPTRAENSYHVLVASATDDTPVLDGFTITGGNANEESYPGTCSGAGLYSDSGSPTLLNLIFSANSACDGGGVANYNGSNPTLENVSFNSNFADNGGGMANQSASSPALKSVSFNSNSANHGGGMANYNGSSPTLENASFNSNTAGIGGGMANQSSTPTLENVSFNSNAAEHYGGGISNENNSSSVLINVTFSANSAVHDGGGMYNLGSSPTLNYVIFNGNTAGNAGGGMLINLASSPTLTDVVFEFNSASNFGGGTAIGTDSSPNLMNVTFHANSADYGGGMLNSQNSSPTLTNVTFSGNSAKEGGGMRNKSTSSPVLTNVTFSGNSAKKGGGMLNLDDSRPTLKNVIIANSMSGGDCVNEGSSALNTASGYNLIEDNVNNCGLILVSNNIIGQDPLLGKLQDNGGFTQTHALWLGSPAINAGTNTGCPATDQRGIARPQGARCDIGAYEYVRRIIFLKTGHIMIE